MSDDDSGHTGKFLKWGLWLILIGIFPPFLFIIIFWKYVKLCVIFYFKMLYLIIRFPIWLFIQLPLHYLGVGVHKISNAFSKAYAVMKTKKKRYGLLFGIIFFLTIQMFLPENTDAMISFITDATLIMPLILFIPFFITFLVAFISAHFNMPDVARKEMPGGLNTGTKRRTAEAAAAAGAAGQMGAKAGKMGMKAYNNKEKIKGAAETATDVAEAAGGEGALAGDMLAVMEEMPLLGSMVAGGGEVAGAGATIAGLSGGTAIIGFIALLILGVIGFIAISAILSALLWSGLMWMTSVLAPLMSPILGAIGLGQAYGNWIGSEVANNLLPQVNLDAETRMIEQAGAKIGCFLKGPSCIEQWRMNHTTRPGSEDVGEKYRLKVKNFGAGGQGGIDIAYKQEDYNIPVSFLLLNTRHGLKGIDARDVRYRVRIIDADRSGDKAYCSTGWKRVDSSLGRSGTILPGTSFSPRIDQLNNLTIEKCDMLQPALGHDYTARLDVKYDYSSQSTLYVEAMSRRNMRSQKITPKFKKSKTADTPVETYINVKAPVTYVDGDEGTRPISFTVKVGTATDRFDVEYRIHPNDFKIVDSSKTEHEGGDSCVGMAPIESTENRDNDYQLSERAKNRIQNRIEKNDLTTWFDKAKNPSPARCTFKLKRPRSISPTGETLTFRVDANYTVNIEKTSDPFEVKNTRCSQFECPILFDLNQDNFQQLTKDESSIPPPKWKNPDSDNPKLTENFKHWKYAVCNGIDAGNGCSATDGYDSSYNRSQVTGGIDEDEIAVKWNEAVANTNNLFSCYVKANPTSRPDKEIVGIEKDELKEVMGNEEGDEVSDWKRLNYSHVTEEFEVVEYKDTLTDKQGIPWVAEIKYTLTFKAGTCTEKGPKYKLVNKDAEALGVIPASADIAGTVGSAVLKGGGYVASGTIELLKQGAATTYEGAKDAATKDVK
ncbi:MAG: hypothetical protein ABEK04_02980 [Candidatus Nanohalobium sp.]